MLLTGYAACFSLQTPEMIITPLGRYPEALELVEKLKFSCRDKIQLELAAIQIHMARCEWDESKKRLDRLSLRGALHPEDRLRYSQIIKWLKYCCDHPDEYITDVQYLRNLSLSNSINPELGFREWVFDKASSEVLVYGSDPVRDFNSGIRPDKDYLRTLMLSWDERGLETIQRYFLHLDQYVREKYGSMNSDVDSEEFGRVKDFCREARENGLSLVEDILNNKPHLNSAVLGKLFFLMRLERYQDALNYTENFLRSGARLLPLELRRVEAFAEAGMFAEAWKQLEKTRRFFDKDRDKTGLVAINLYIKDGDFSGAMSHLNEIKINNYIDEETFRRNVELIDRKLSDKMGSVSLVGRKSEAVEDLDDVGDDSMVEKADSFTNNQVYSLSESDQILLDSARRNHNDGFFSTAFTLLSVIRGRNIGENQTVDQLYLECEQKKGSCRVINFPKP
ncbi:hypothetical protein [Endozoicomonas atrinae]|uniref:hypothetical protein n=1 Tax=Endozoicomonas atrinae TaxID=1333660 RepID=UPI003AFFE4CC